MFEELKLISKSLTTQEEINNHIYKALFDFQKRIENLEDQALQQKLEAELTKK